MLLNLHKCNHFDFSCDRPRQREPEEIQHLGVFLKMKVPFFSSCKQELITTLIDKLICQKFKQGDSLMDQGDVGDCMYIIYEGQCGVYVFNSKTDLSPESSHNAVAILGANTVVGESAVTDVFEEGTRSATIVAHTEVVTLKLTKQNYQKILKQHQDDERMARLRYL